MIVRNLVHALLPVLVCCLAAPAHAEGTAPESVRECFHDPLFQEGFRVTTAQSADQPNERGNILPHAPTVSVHPPWRLAQWGSRHLLQPGIVPNRADGAWVLKTPGKHVMVQRDDAGAPTLSLHVDGGAEYGGHLRERGEAWPHLLIEQKLGEDGIRIHNTPLRFRAAFRVTRCERAAGVARTAVDPGRHTAQVSAYWTAHALRDGQPTRDMFWFGIPFFDARHAIPPGHFAVDFAPGTGGKFISNIPGKNFYETPTGNGEWHMLDVDLLPHLEAGLKRAHEAGHFPDVTVSDLQLTSFNLGWELPGPYNATIEIRGLSLTCKQ